MPIAAGFQTREHGSLGGKQSGHTCLRALGPDLGSSAPGRPGNDRPTDPWRQLASVQLPGDRCDHQPPFCSRRRERSEEEGTRRRWGEREGSARAVHATASGCGADGTAEFRSGEERDLRSLKRMLLGAVTAMVLAAGVAVSPASATVPSKGKVGIGENANVPYLAWRGEHVRLGFCAANAEGAPVGRVDRQLAARRVERRSAQLRRRTVRARELALARPRAATTASGPPRRPASPSSSSPSQVRAATSSTTTSS